VAQGSCRPWFGLYAAKVVHVAGGGEGMEAMASRRAYARLAQLWQLPLLLISLGLFGYAAYLFIDPQPGLTVEERINSAKTFLAQERPDAANALLNRILSSEKLNSIQQGSVHLLIAESLEMAQKQLRIAVPANYISIIEQTRLATANNAKLDWQAYGRDTQHCRVGRSIPKRASRTIA